MSDYFSNIFDLMPEKTPENNRIGKPLKKKKKQKAGGVTGVSNKEFSLDEFLSPENVAKDIFELPPSESTSTQGPILTDAQKKAVKSQDRWNTLTDKEKEKAIEIHHFKQITSKLPRTTGAPITVRQSTGIRKALEGKPYTYQTQQK